VNWVTVEEIKTRAETLKLADIFAQSGDG